MTKKLATLKYINEKLTLDTSFYTLENIHVDTGAYLNYLSTDGFLKIDESKKIYNNLVNENDINDLAITSNKIQDLSISNEKLQNLSISNEKLQDLSISTEKIQNLSITSDKLSLNINLNSYSFNKQKINFIYIENDNSELNDANNNNFILNSNDIFQCNLNCEQEIGNVINVYNNTSNNILINSLCLIYNLILCPENGANEVIIMPNNLYTFIYFNNKWVLKM